MRQIPEKPLASPGRLPSDIDGDVAKVRCHYCGRMVSEDQAEFVPLPFHVSVISCRNCLENRDE